MKIVVKYRPDIALDAAITDFIKMVKDICDNYPVYRENYGQMLKSSLTNLKRNKRYVIQLLSDDLCPLSKIGPKGVHLIKDKLMAYVGTESNYYCYRPMLLIQHILILMLVSGEITDENLIKIKGLRNQYLKCGNMAETLGDGHGKEILSTLIRNGNTSIHWKRVEWFLEATD